MLEYAGQEVKIINVIETNEGFYYIIDKDYGHWSWSVNMFDFDTREENEL